MVSTSNDGIMTEYLATYGGLKLTPDVPRDKQKARAKLLETLYMAEQHRAGTDLAVARRTYDPSQWADVPDDELDRRLADLDRFMAALARDRLLTWGVSIRH